MNWTGTMLCLCAACFSAGAAIGQEAGVGSLETAASRVERAGTATPLKPTLKATVYFSEEVDRSTVMRAERVAAEIFKQSAIEVDWRNCPGAACAGPAEGLEFRLHIHRQIGNLASDHAQAKLMRENRSLGLAIPCAMTDSVCLAYIFYRPIRSAALEEEDRTAVVLGHVMAHEIGHALLGPDSHGRTGVMQSRLPIASLERFLQFTSRESQDLVANLMQRNRLQNTSRGSIIADNSPP